MFNRIINKIISPVSIFSHRNHSSHARTNKHKPLSMQFIYPSQQLFKPAVGVDLAAPQPAAKTRLTKAQAFVLQKDILRNMPQYSNKEVVSIECHTLTPRDRVIGLLRHTKPILGSVIMSSMSARYDQEWEALLDSANALDTSIGIFRPKQEIRCLMITNAETNSVQYLINHADIRLYERVRTAQKNTTELGSEKNCKSVRN